MRWGSASSLAGVLAAALTLGSAALAAGPPAADVAQARTLLNEGLALRDRGKPQEALEKVRAAYELIRTPITGAELGRTYVVLGQLLEARETFLAVVRIPVTREETARSAAARQDCARLADEILPRIPSLRVHVAGAPAASVKVAIDGVDIPPDALGSPRQLDPGPHQVTAKADTGPGDEATVTLKESETRDVELKLAPPPAAALAAPSAPVQAKESAPAPKDSPPTKSSSALGWWLLGGGAVLGATGAVLLGVEAGAGSRASDTNDRAAYDRARTGWTVGLAGAIAGGALAATGAVVVLVSSHHGGEPDASASAWVGFTGREVQLGTTW